MMYENFDREGIKIIDHAHDRNSSVNKQVKDRQGTTNSNDPWHGTKPIKCAFKKIASGSRANIGRTWHPELSDKGSKFRNQGNRSMEHCNGNAVKLLCETCWTAAYCIFRTIISNVVLNSLVGFRDIYLTMILLDHPMRSEYP